MDISQDKVCLTVQTLQRLPYYLQYLKQAHALGERTVSAAGIAAELKLGEVLVRKDIAQVSTVAGRPKTGFEIETLMNDIERCLGCNNTKDAVLVGVGSLGRALLGSREFERYGLNIAAAFDVDEAVIGSVYHGKQVFSLDKIALLCERMYVHIGILTVPAEFAQNAANLLTSCGIRALWNFAPVCLDVPENVLVRNENLAASLAVLSQHLSKELAVGNE